MALDGAVGRASMARGAACSVGAPAHLHGDSVVVPSIVAGRVLSTPLSAVSPAAAWDAPRHRGLVVSGPGARWRSSAAAALLEAAGGAASFDS